MVLECTHLHPLQHLLHSQWVLCQTNSSWITKDPAVESGKAWQEGKNAKCSKQLKVEREWSTLNIGPQSHSNSVPQVFHHQGLLHIAISFMHGPMYYHFQDSQTAWNLLELLSFIQGFLHIAISFIHRPVYCYHFQDSQTARNLLELLSFIQGVLCIAISFIHRPVYCYHFQDSQTARNLLELLSFILDVWCITVQFFRTQSISSTASDTSTLTLDYSLELAKLVRLRTIIDVSTLSTATDPFSLFLGQCLSHSFLLLAWLPLFSFLFATLFFSHYFILCTLCASARLGKFLM